MATYIEKHTIVTKDTLNVDHNNRETFQHVKFMNPKNVYMGTFMSTGYKFEDLVSHDIYEVVLSGGYAVISGDNSEVAIVNADQIKDLLDERTVSSYGAIPSLPLISALNDTINKKIAHLDNSTAKLSGNNDISGYNRVEELDISSLSAAQTTISSLAVVDGLSANMLSVQSLNDIIADGKTLSSVLSGIGADVEALEDEMHAADLSIVLKLNDAVDNLIDRENTISAQLSDEVIQLSTNLSTDIGSLSAALSDEIQILSGQLSDEVEQLSSSLSDEVIQLSTNLSTDIDSISAVLSTDYVDKIDNALTSANSYTDTVSALLSTNILNVNVSAESTPTDGYLKTYTITQGGIERGKIDIPKDFLVKSGSVETVVEPDKPYPGAKKGDKYIDLVINSKDDTTQDGTHLYIPANSLVDIYEGYSGICITTNVNGNIISADINLGSISKDKLSSDVLSSLDLADSSLQLSDIVDISVSTESVVAAANAYNVKKELTTLSSYITTIKYFDNDPVSAQLSVVKLSAEDYYALVADNATISNALYVVEDTKIDAYGQQIKNVATPTDLSDAATKEYVDGGLSSKQDTIADLEEIRLSAANALPISEKPTRLPNPYALSVVTAKNEIISYDGSAALSIDIGNIARIWSTDDGFSNRYVDGNRQLGYAAKTWTRSDTGAVYLYKGYNVSTSTHSWYADSNTYLTYNKNTGEIKSNEYLIATVAAEIDPWRMKFDPIEVRPDLTFTYTDDDSFFIAGKFAFVTDIEGEENARINADKSKLDSEVLDKAYDSSKTYEVDNTCTYEGKWYKCKTSITTPHAWIANEWEKMITIEEKLALKVDKKVPAASGNLAKLNASGNLDDTGKKLDDFVLKSDNPVRIGLDTPGDIGVNAVAIGRLAKAYAERSVAIGGAAAATEQTSALAKYSVALGPGAKVDSTAQSAVQLGSGTNTKKYSLQFRDCLIAKPVDDTQPPSANNPIRIISANLDKSFLETLSAISWSDLKAKRDGDMLIPGQQYRITDYVATTNGNMDSQSANHPFDIIVTADDKHKLNEHARAVMHDGDLPDDIIDGNVRTKYFAKSNLAAWDVWYCIDNDTNRFAWAVADGGKGVIYRLVDEFQNDVPYDFKGIQFKAYGDTDDVYRFTFDAARDIDSSLKGQTARVYGNRIAPFLVDSDRKRTLNRIVFKVGQQYANIFGPNCHSNTFRGLNCYNNVFGAGCTCNTFSSMCYNNRFGQQCSNNALQWNCYGNTFGARCTNNQFDRECHCNTLDSDCDSNIFDYGCQFNVLKGECTDNRFDMDCSYNTVGQACGVNEFGSGCSLNTIGPRSDGNVFGDGCGHNNLGEGSQYNEFGDSCSYNTLGQGNNYNIFGSNCSSNTFSANCNYIKFGNANVTASYCSNICVAAGNQHIYINPTGTSSSAYYQNVEIKAGMSNKTINDTNVNQNFLTTYQPANSIVISI